MGQECAEQATFAPQSWYIERVPSGWKIVGWSDTHRMCGYGLDFVVDVDPSPVTGRTTAKTRWQQLQAAMPDLVDAHFSPGGNWVLAVTKAV